MESKSDNIQSGWYLLFAIWLTACLAMLGSLFFSEIMKYPPCVLCWYQRIWMYPLVLISFSGLLKFDAKIVRYLGPLTIIGWLTSIYHNLIYLKIIPEGLSPCAQGISCSTVYVQYLGFITIPLMSFVAFSIILTLWVFLIRDIKRE